MTTSIYELVVRSSDLQENASILWGFRTDRWNKLHYVLFFFLLCTNLPIALTFAGHNDGLEIKQ